MPSDARHAFNHQVERRLREALTSSSDELELAKVQLQEAQLRLSATVNEARETRKQLKLQAAATRLAAAAAALTPPAVPHSLHSAVDWEDVPVMVSVLPLVVPAFELPCRLAHLPRGRQDA